MYYRGEFPHFLRDNGFLAKCLSEVDETHYEKNQTADSDEDVSDPSGRYEVACDEAYSDYEEDYGEDLVEGRAAAVEGFDAELLGKSGGGAQHCGEGGKDEDDSRTHGGESNSYDD